MRIDVSEVLELADDIDRNATETLPKAQMIVAKTGHDLVAVAQSVAPVETGALKNSISVDIADGGLGFEAGPTVDYGLYVEQGTSRMAPEPYMTPSADAVLPRGEAALAQLGIQIISRGA